MKELFRNKTVRRYFISGILDMPVEDIKSVRLMRGEDYSRTEERL